MYMNMYTYICIYIYTHTYIYIYIYLYVYMYKYIWTCVSASHQALAGVLSGQPGFCGGRCLAGLCMCLARSLSLLSTDNAPYRSPLAISLDLSRCIYICTYIYMYIYIYMYFKHCQCTTPLSATSLSLSCCIYIYLYIFIYIYILQALTVHHTPLPCLCLHTSSAYRDSFGVSPHALAGVWSGEPGVCGVRDMHICIHLHLHIYTYVCIYHYTLKGCAVPCSA